MSRIVILNRFFFPDHSATSQIVSDLAFTLAADGRDVHVVTSRQLYDAPNAALAKEEHVRGVHVMRVGGTSFGRATLKGRTADYASCYAGMAQATLALTQPGDVVVAMTDPPLLSILGEWIGRRRGATLINWMQDIYPDIAAATGVPMMKGFVAGGLMRLRDRSLRFAGANVVLGTAMAAHLRSLGIPPRRIEIIANWTDDRAIVPLPRADNPLRQAWGLGDRFIVGYSGNLGRTQDIAPLLAAAEALRHRSDIVFVFIGGGAQFEQIETQVASKRLGGTVRLFPYQPSEQLPLSLTLPDVHWLSLRPSLEGLLFPSKFYGIAAAGRPMLALAKPDGEIAQLMSQHRCGIIVPANDTHFLVDAITALTADRAACEAMGARARAMLDTHFNRARAIGSWRELLARTLS